MTAGGGSEQGLDERFQFGRRLIVEAGALALDYSRRVGTLTVAHKGVQDLATEADLETERLIRRSLTEQFPEDAFLGEETGRGEVEGSTGIWVVDPIDGTQPFVSGMTGWGVSIAYVAGGRFEMGFVTAPARDELFIGRRGHGATLNDRPIEVSQSERLDDGIVGVGYSPRITPDQILAVLEPLLRQGAIYYRTGSGALDLCDVACGRLIGFVEPHINSWDCAGALTVVQAAGGRTNDFLAGDGLWNGGPIVAGPPALYPTLAALFEGRD